MANIKSHLLFLLISLISYPMLAQNIGDIQMENCFLENCEGLESPEVEFGFITVPENYQKPEGRLIKVAFSIIKARIDDPKPDAFIYFEGGWGNPKVYDTKRFMDRFPVQDRDIILFDFRGTGYSEPALCTDFGEEVYNDLMNNFSYSEFKEKQSLRFSNCLDDLKEKNIEFTQYNSSNGMRDVNLLMDKLNYESYNLFGISYGTRRIQELLKLTDQNIHSVVLDSNCPIGTGFTISAKMSGYYYEVISSLLSDCESDPNCKRAFPDLKRRFNKFLGELEEQPLHFINDENEVYLNAVEVNGILHQLLYSRYYYSVFPILLEAMINREASALAVITDNMKADVVESSNGVGLINYIADWNIYQSQSKKHYKRFIEGEHCNFEVLDLYLHFFLEDNDFPVDSINAIPVVSEVPALILSGTYDPITPPELSESLLPNFKNHYYYKFNREGHGPASSECGEPMWMQFINNPDNSPDQSCLEEKGENKIEFRTTYYKNSKMLQFVIGFTSKMNWILLVAISFIVIVNVVSIVLAIIRLFKKGNKSHLSSALTSLLIIVFLCALGYYIQLTSSQKGIILLFGLLAESKWIFYLVPIVIVFAIYSAVKILKSQKHSISNYILISSFAVFVLVVFWYRLYPDIL